MSLYGFLRWLTVYCHFFNKSRWDKKENSFLPIKTTVIRQKLGCWETARHYLLYNKASGCGTVSGEIIDLFARKGRLIDNSSPTEAALIQRTKWVWYMASRGWNKCLELNSQLVDPGTWVWKKNETNTCMWIPFLTVLPEASASCMHLAN